MYFISFPFIPSHKTPGAWSSRWKAELVLILRFDCFPCLKGQEAAEGTWMPVPPWKPDFCRTWGAVELLQCSQKQCSTRNPSSCWERQLHKLLEFSPHWKSRAQRGHWRLFPTQAIPALASGTLKCVPHSGRSNRKCQIIPPHARNIV